MLLSPFSYSAQLFYLWLLSTFSSFTLQLFAVQFFCLWLFAVLFLPFGYSTLCESTISNTIFHVCRRLQGYYSYGGTTTSAGVVGDLAEAAAAWARAPPVTAGWLWGEASGGPGCRLVRGSVAIDGTRAVAVEAAGAACAATGPEAVAGALAGLWKS
jgi:hypothetical protein